MPEKHFKVALHRDTAVQILTDLIPELLNQQLSQLLQDLWLTKYPINTIVEIIPPDYTKDSIDFNPEKYKLDLNAIQKINQDQKQ